MYVCDVSPLGGRLHIRAGGTFNGVKCLSAPVLILSGWFCLVCMKCNFIQVVVREGLARQRGVVKGASECCADGLRRVLTNLTSGPLGLARLRCRCGCVDGLV